MASTSLQLISTDPTAKTSTLSITNVAPTSTSEQAVQFTQKLNALTKNSYVRTDRIDKINCDTEAPSVGKLDATITPVKASVTTSELSNPTTNCTFTYTSDGTPYAYITNPDRRAYGISCMINSGQNSGSWYVAGTENLNAPQTVTIRIDETDNYKAASATVTITA